MSALVAIVGLLFLCIFIGIIAYLATRPVRNDKTTDDDIKTQRAMEDEIRRSKVLANNAKNHEKDSEAQRDMDVYEAVKSGEVTGITSYIKKFGF